MNRSVATTLAVCALATCATVGAPATAHASGAAQSITLEVDDAAPVVGHRIRLTGTVRPAAKGTPVVLQVRDGNRRSWKDVDRAAAGLGNRFAFMQKIETDRTRRYRVVRPADARHPRSQSVPVTVVAHAFLGQPSRDDLEINLARRCSQFEAVYGLEDHSGATAISTAGVSSDGVAVLTQTSGLGQAVSHSVDVDGVFRLSLGYTSPADAIVGLGDPRVLCHD